MSNEYTIKCDRVYDPEGKLFADTTIENAEIIADKFNGNVRDGHGSLWGPCPECFHPMTVVRPGKVQCDSLKCFLRGLGIDDPAVDVPEMVDLILKLKGLLNCPFHEGDVTDIDVDTRMILSNVPRLANNFS